MSRSGHFADTIRQHEQTIKELREQLAAEGKAPAAAGPRRVVGLDGVPRFVDTQEHSFSIALDESMASATFYWWNADGQIVAGEQQPKV